MTTHTGRRWMLLGAGLVAAACDEGPTVTLQPGTEIACSIPESMIFRAQAVNGIPALTNPDLVTPGAPGTEPFRDEDRVVGIVWEGRQIAVPLNIFWWHEIVNFELAGNPRSVTHCPLTGSSIGFDRAGLPQVDLGVSGLLYQNNLIMYDRAGGSDTLWPQMALGARCGALSGASPPTIPVVEMTYGAWRALHPETLVVSADTGHHPGGPRACGVLGFRSPGRDGVLHGSRRQIPELQGLALEPVSSAFVAFWFAWPRFFPDISLWRR